MSDALVHRCLGHKIEGWKGGEAGEVVWTVDVRPKGWLAYMPKMALDLDIRFCPWCGEELT